DHQVWSEAMVATPLLRGLLGIEAGAGGRSLRFAPSLPADWERVAVRNVAAGQSRYDLSFARSAGRATIVVERRGEGPSLRLVVAPAFPRDARVLSVLAGGRTLRFDTTAIGDVQRIEVALDAAAARTQLELAYDEGSE